MNESRQPEPERPESGAPRLSQPRLPKASATELEKRAAQAGKAAGTAVAILRDAKQRLREPRREPSADRLNALGIIARTRAWELRRRAAEKAEAWRRAAMEITAEIERQAKTGYAKARERAQRAGRGYPVHVVIAAGVAGFLMGAGLRMRRSHRAG